MKKVKLIPLEKSVEKTISVPGSKSYTNRALILGALTPNNVTIINPLISDDTTAMISCLKTLGIKISYSEHSIEVQGNIDDIEEKTYTLNAHLSGTTIRFLLSLLCIVPGTKILKGDEGLNKRPIKDLVDALRQRGAEIEYLEKEGFPPLKITSNKLSEGSISMNGNVSSQFFSSILMIAPKIGDITIQVVGDQISKPYIDITIDSLKEFGISVTNNNYTSYHVPNNQKYKNIIYEVEGDYSAAGYFFAIAVLTNSKIKVDNLNPHSSQADKKFLDILKMMGNDIEFGKNSVTIIGGKIKPLRVDMNACPDQAQTLAVLAAFAKGTTLINGIHSLRVKETERIQALQNELAKMGIKTDSTTDSLTIFGGNPKPAMIDTYGDHRMAMSFAVAGAVLKEMKIKDPDVVKKTFPDFWKKIELLGIGVTYAI